MRITTIAVILCLVIAVFCFVMAVLYYFDDERISVVLPMSGSKSQVGTQIGGEIAAISAHSFERAPGRLSVAVIKFDGSVHFVDCNFDDLGPDDGAPSD